MYMYIGNLSLLLYIKKVICHSSPYFVPKSRPRREGLYVHHMVLENNEGVILPLPCYFSSVVVIPEKVTKCNNQQK